MRNEGIIARDVHSATVRFRQFNVFGGITEGHCLIGDGGIVFEYEYEVKDETLTMRDVWQQQNADTWKYSVVQMKDGRVEKVYMEAEFKKKIIE